MVFFQQYVLGCLSQLSYVVGDESTGRAVVVDPHRDVSVYLQDATERGLRRVDEVATGDDERSGGQSGQTCDNPEQRRLARAARAQYDTGLLVLDGQREPLESGDAARRGRVHGKELPGLDERAHASVSR